MDIPFVDNDNHAGVSQYYKGNMRNSKQNSFAPNNSADAHSPPKETQHITNDIKGKGEHSYLSTAQIMINSSINRGDPEWRDSLDPETGLKDIISNVKLGADKSSNDKTYEVITYYNDIYAATLSPANLKLTPTFSPRSSNGDLSNAPTGVSPLGSPLKQPDWPRYQQLSNGFFPNERASLIPIGSDDARSIISEMSSVCEFDSDGEEIDLSDSDGKVDPDVANGKINFKPSKGTEAIPHSTGGNDRGASSKAGLIQIHNKPVNKQPTTEGTSDNDTESPQVPYHKIDRFGFFGGNQYLPPPSDEEENSLPRNLSPPTLSPPNRQSRPAQYHYSGDSASTSGANDQPAQDPDPDLNHLNGAGTLKGNEKMTKAKDKARARALVKLRTREKKWKGMLDHWDKYSRHKPEKLRERCRKGIPPALRGLAWQYLSGAPGARGKNTELFRLLASEDQRGDPVVMDEIRRDLHRQFPYHEMFAHADGPGQRDLFAVLKVYSLMRPADGYCQAQAPLAACLLMQMPAEPAFWCLLSICDNYLPGYFGPGLEALQLDGQLFYGLLKRHQPAVYRLLRTQGIQPSLCITEWFMCLYSRTLPWPCVLRVWDLFLSEGIAVLFKVGLVLFKLAFSPPSPAHHGSRDANTSPGAEGGPGVASSSPSTPSSAKHQGRSGSNRSLPLLHSLTGTSVAALNARYPTMYETMGALQAIKTRPVDDDYLIGEVVKLRIPKEAFERERQYPKKRK